MKHRNEFTLGGNLAGHRVEGSMQALVGGQAPAKRGGAPCVTAMPPGACRISSLGLTPLKREPRDASQNRLGGHIDWLFLLKRRPVCSNAAVARKAEP